MYPGKLRNAKLQLVSTGKAWVSALTNAYAAEEDVDIRSCVFLCFSGPEQHPHYLLLRHLHDCLWSSSAAPAVSSSRPSVGWGCERIIATRPCILYDTHPEYKNRLTQE
jgi:hypothetical protein